MAIYLSWRTGVDHRLHTEYLRLKSRFSCFFKNTYFWLVPASSSFSSRISYLVALEGASDGNSLKTNIKHLSLSLLPEVCGRCRFPPAVPHHVHMPGKVLRIRKISRRLAKNKENKRSYEVPQPETPSQCFFLIHTFKLRQEKPRRGPRRRKY